LIDSKFSIAICAPVYSNCTGISTQVKVGVEEGLKHTSCIACDELVSLPKNMLTNYVGKLAAEKINELNKALCIATGVL
jgi:mRNA interferase MazF